MSVARQHAEWLKLLDVSGPFLSLPVLQRAFPQGLEAHDPDAAARLRQALAEWEADPDPEIHGLFVRFVLTGVLGWPDDLLHEGQAVPDALAVPVPEHGERLRPDILLGRSPDAPAGERLLLRIAGRDQDLERPLPGRRWKESPAGRMAVLLRGTGTRVGLLTNGGRWMLVDAPRDGTTGFATWQADLLLDEPLTLRAFRSLLGPGRVLGAAAGERLADLFAKSAEHQQEVTDQLGRQVRRAVEILVQQLDQADRAQQGRLLDAVPDRRVYEAAVTVMMRLVFLFCAEERELLPMDEDHYVRFYAATTLRDQLRETAEQHGEEVLERRTDAWHRLLALFRAVHGGVGHEDLHLPPYGGHLFDPDRYPFLEGRRPGGSWRAEPARPLPIHNRTVLLLLEALQLLYDRKSRETQRLSFRALDIEQIGHVYEGLLDHTVERAREPVVSLKGREGDEPELPVSRLESLVAEGPDRLAGALRKETHRSAKALAKDLDYAIPPGHEQRFLVRCGNDPEVWGRVRPFAGLVRDDVTGYPVVFPEGSLYVTAGAERRVTGTHYTPRSLTEPLVQHALDPLVYEGPAEGRPRAEWRLRPARDLLGLRVCDFACGSGAFLVQACRYLAAKLVEAWSAAEEAGGGGVVVTPEGDLSEARPSEGLIPRDEEERLALARRIVTDRCLFGVDKNDMAAEMAKLSLWLVTLQRNRPFTFLDHAVRCGDSLLGVTDPEQLLWFHMDTEEGRKLHKWVGGVQAATREALQRARELRRKLESFPVLEPRDAERKAELLAESDALLDDLRLTGDLLAGAALVTSRKRSEFDETLKTLGTDVERLLDPATDEAGRAQLRERLRKTSREMLDRGRPATAISRRPLHWPLEFPEVFLAAEAAAGFAAVVGNPPFQGGQRITGSLGTDYRDHLVEHIAGGQRGSADLCAYFFLRGRQLLRAGGTLGLLATNTIAQGDTREVGLDQLLAGGCSIPRAVPSRTWPGDASLEVAHVWVRRGPWDGDHILDDRRASGINAWLVEPGTVTGKPHRLAANRGKSFIGSYVLGMGFVLPPEEARALIAKDARNEDVLYPYLNGRDLNSRPDQSPSRFVINFHDWPLDRESAPDGYEGPVAADYPDCLAIVREKVKPERESKTYSKTARENWWLYERWRPELYATIAGLERVLVKSEVGQILSFAFVPNRMVYSHMLIVFPTEDCAVQAVLQSSLHEAWVRQQASTMRTDTRYTPSDCFDTFPMPRSLEPLAAIASNYDARRRHLMQANGLGLTPLYNLFHEPSQGQVTIGKLRDLHVQMDRAVAAAYEWDDLDLEHGFHETKQGTRFTISEAARREVLQRLLELNHERYEEEVIEGLHRRKREGKRPSRRTKRNRPTSNETGDLFS